MAVDGEIERVEEYRYEELVANLLPPRQRQQVPVKVTTADRLPEQGIVELFLFDIVTAIDSAGNVTERQNFDWTFRVTHERRAVRTVTGLRTHWWVPNAEAKAIVRAQRRGEDDCRSHRGWVRF